MPWLSNGWEILYTCTRAPSAALGATSTVRAVTLDVALHIPGAGSMFKIDAEAAEGDILSGAATATLQRAGTSCWNGTPIWSPTCQTSIGGSELRVSPEVLDPLVSLY